MNRTLTRLFSITAALGVGLALLGGSATPASADTVPNNHIVKLLPYRGMYYTAGHGGTGLTVDVDKNGYVFAVFYTYDKDGNPYYYLMEGMYKAKSEDDRQKSGLIGTLDATAYISENGECVGSGCTYKSPERSLTNIHAHLEWSSPRNLHLELGDQSWDIQGGQYTISDGDNLLGTWAVNSWGTDSANSKPYYRAIVCNISKASVRFQPSDFPTRYDDKGNLVAGVVVPEDADLYRMKCDAAALDDTFVWHQASTGRTGLFSANLGFGDAPPTSADDVFGYATLYADGPNTIRARLDYGGDSASNGGMAFVRLPAGVSTWERP